MEKINYGYIFEKNYPECKWIVLAGRKMYEYEAYVWDETNNITMPTQEELNIQWQTVKRNTWVWEQVIKQRNEKLQESDKYVLSDYPHESEEIKQTWLNYRQELRNFTITGNPTVNEQNKIDVTWPTKPN